jgi:predicted Fe-Mo cluster-binding NifX family protein
MRIAVSYEKDSGRVFQHFGHTECFMLYNVEDGKIVSSLVIAAPEQGHDALADFLAQMRVNALICGGIGGGGGGGW